MLIILQVVAALIAIIIAYYSYHHSYWKKKNFPYIPPSIPFGNLQIPLFNQKESVSITMMKLYNKIKKENKWKHGGIYFFATPMYMPADLDYLKHILTKDFDHFTDRGTFYNEKTDPLSAHLFAIGGVKWRNLRTKLSPTFTSGKMKSMFHTFVECEKLLVEGVNKLAQNQQAVDIKDITSKFTTDIIGLCAFGLECNSFVDEDSQFRYYGKRLFKFSPLRRLFFTFAVNFPRFGRAIGVRFFTKEVSDFFMKVVHDAVSYRETNNVVRKDFLQLLIDLKNNTLAEEEGYQHDGRTLTLNEVAAQCVVFFLAGFETSSTTMTFAMYLLSKHPEIQEKVREEVNRVLEKYDGKYTYEGMNEMKYLQQVIDETLRLYPAVPFVTRVCVKDYKLPGSDLVIEKPTRIFIPILGVHHDEEYWPNPEEFDPERFSEENKRHHHPYSYLPFGEGPRICIGMRFGLLQSKVGLASLLKNYRFTVNEKTQEPLTMSKNSFVLAAEGDIWLNAEKI